MLEVNKISPRLGTTVTLGDSGDTFTCFHIKMEPCITIQDKLQSMVTQEDVISNNWYFRISSYIYYTRQQLKIHKPCKLVVTLDNVPLVTYKIWWI